MLRALSPTKIDTVSFFPVTLAGYGYLHTHMYAIHTHALTCSHIHTYTHYTPAIAVSRNSSAPGCVHFPPLSSAGERPVAAEGSLPLETGGLGQAIVGEGEE